MSNSYNEDIVFVLDVSDSDGGKIRGAAACTPNTLHEFSMLYFVVDLKKKEDFFRFIYLQII